MPAIKTNTRTRRKRQSGQARSLEHRLRREPAVISSNGRTTHVVLPVDEYERLIRLSEVPELIARSEDESVKWIDGDDLGAILAADQIAEARKKAGLTQSQLAARLKIPQSQISRIERNPDRTTVRTLKRIARALGVNVRSLLRS